MLSFKNDWILKVNTSPTLNLSISTKASIFLHFIFLSNLFSLPQCKIPRLCGQNQIHYLRDTNIIFKLNCEMVA